MRNINDPPPVIGPYLELNQKPRSIMGQKSAFIDHPKGLCGLLAEVIE
jgi:hypothetical protein